jgi:hypothetical protein
MCSFGATQYAAPASPQSPAQPVAEIACPWLTSGTAAAALGGEVSVTASVSESGEGICKFGRQQGPARSLEIVVSKTALPACPPGSLQLKGIGNHAELCKRPGSPGESVQLLSSRVRDQYFTLTLTSHLIEKQPAADLQEQPLENIGEQVAGNLY